MKIEPSFFLCANPGFLTGKKFHLIYRYVKSRHLFFAHYFTRVESLQYESAAGVHAGWRNKDLIPR